MTPLQNLSYLFLNLCTVLLLFNIVPARSEVFYSIKEELSPGTIFGYLVDDSNLRRKVSPDELSNLRFSFLTTGNSNREYFAIDPKTGVLSVAKRIDRETVCSFRQDCVLSVSAVAQSELGPFFHIIKVKVQVTDVNDNPPTFSQPVFEVMVPENAPLGLSYPLPTAFDQDTGNNNTVKDYFLMSGHNTFSLTTTQDELGNMQTALQLLRQLNREHTSTMTVLVGARDGGRPPLTGTLTVKVLVTDINDNYPIFEKYAYSVNVSETTRTNDPLLQVHAEDADVGPNGNLTYRFSKLQPKEVLKLFRMNSISGTMFLARSVENQTGRIFELVVEASDQGKPPKVSRALVRVRVLDTVNSRPDIVVDILSSSSDEQSEVSEYAEVGKVVAYVSVTDPDSGENGVTVCRLNTKDFELQPLNSQGQYKVILVTNLDRERIARYQISVSCTDFGFPPLENSKRFVVNVKDENDNVPIFSQRNYFTTIKENGTVGAVITTLTVMDADEGLNAEVTYRVAGAHRNEFRILNNGTMIATAPLDREVSERLVVKVLAVDKGFPPLSGSATVFITLEDVNDMAPRFGDRGYSFSVAEDARPGTFVGIVSAEDDDKGRNAEVSFMPAPGPEPALSAFMITREGVVKTKRRLDREKKEIHYFTVVATDGGDPPLSSTTTLTIHVDDVNDNIPYFVYPTEANDSLSIPHTFPLRTPITQIRATDRDAGMNSALVYSCASVNDSALFGMDPKSGDLYLNRHFNRGQVGLYILRVAAHDEGTPQLSNQTLLFLDVYFDNSTLLDQAQAAAPSSAVVTALVLVGVVLVVAGIVTIIAIVCLRRRDAQKKHEATPGVQQTPPTKSPSGYYIAPGVCESPAFGGGMSNTAVLNKPVPEQSLDGDGGEGAGMTSHDVGGGRTANPYVIMPPHSNYSDPDGPPEIIEISRSGMFHRVEDPYPEDDSDRADDSHFSTFRSQDGAFSPSYRQNSLQRHSLDDMDDVKRADDTLSLSELSNQSTSDSGRGGSEFDVNNAGHKGAALKTSSPLPYKGGNTNYTSAPGPNSSFRPRGDPEVSFTTFRGDSPCSFRFDSDNDNTLTRSQPRGQTPHHQQHNSSSSGSNPRTSPLPLSSGSHLQPHHHARSLHSVAGSVSPSVFRPVPPNYPRCADEANSLGRNRNPNPTTAARRAITPGADFSSSSRHGSHVPSFHFPASASTYDRVSGMRGGGGDVDHYESDVDHYQGRTHPETFKYRPQSSQEHHLPPYTVRGGSGGTSTVPPVDFRGRTHMGLQSSRAPDYVNAYSDLDSGDDAQGHGSDVEPTEDQFLLPPYPEALDERPEEEEEMREGEVSERSALNFVPGMSNVSHRSDTSFRSRRSSEV